MKDGLVDLKRTKAEKQKDKNESKLSSPGESDYGYGTRIHLDHEHLEKLGMTQLPAVGDKMHVHAHAHVTSVSEDHNEGGKKRRRVELQIRKLSLKHADNSPGAGDERAAKGAKAAMDAALSKPESGTDDDGDD